MQAVTAFSAASMLREEQNADFIKQAPIFDDVTGVTYRGTRAIFCCCASAGDIITRATRVSIARGDGDCWASKYNR